MTKGTRENIITAFFRLSAKYPDRYDFSFSEIAKEAGISRQTIYRNHFNTPEEILETIHREIDEKIFNIYLEYADDHTHIHPFDYFAEHVIPLLYEHRTWLKYLFSTSADPNWQIFLKEQYKNWVIKNLTVRHEYFKLSKEMTLDLLVNGFLAIIESWITQPIPDPPKVFSKKFKMLCSTPIIDYLDTSESEKN